MNHAEEEIVDFVSSRRLVFVTSSLSAQEGLRKVRIAYPSNTICCLPLFGALKWKVFEENGLQAEIIQVRSQLAYPAMSSGEVPYVAGVGPASVSATLRGMQSKSRLVRHRRADLLADRPPEFQNVKDLRNKKIALTGLGGTSHVALQISLEAVGENPKNFVYIGMGGAQLLPALESGTVEAALFSPPMLYFAKKKGFRELLDVGSRAKMPLGGLTVMNSTIRNRSDELKRVIKSMQAAKQEILKSKEKSVAMIASFLTSGSRRGGRYLSGLPKNGQRQRRANTRGHRSDHKVPPGRGPIHGSKGNV